MLKWNRLKKRKKIGLVVQRYGAEINGGSELLCRIIAEKLSEHYDVEVFTSCAQRYHLRFENEFAPGVYKINGVTVKRYLISSLRPLDHSFSDLDSLVINREATPAQELQWLKWVGPYCEDLLIALKKESKKFECFIFFTYLYAPTTLGLSIVKNKALIVPTVHDEKPVYARYFDNFFARARCIIFNTNEERDFLLKRTHARLENTVVIGAGIDLPKIIDIQADKLPIPARFILYVGRIQREKGVPELMQWYSQLDDDFKNRFPLCLVGEAYVEIPKDRNIIHFGFLSDDEKNYVMQRAALFVMPSPYESLCMALLEAWRHKLPALVNGASPVLLSHCKISRGGWFYHGKEDFEAKITELMLDSMETVRSEMGQLGAKYVEDNYDWNVVIRRYLEVLKETALNSESRLSRKLKGRMNALWHLVGRPEI